MPAIGAKKKKTLAQSLKGVQIKTEPLWKGPEEDGITQSMLSLFVVCRERFRVKVIEGLERDEGFSKPLEYGNMWHECEEAHAMGDDWQDRLLKYGIKLANKYRHQQTEVQKWYRVCKIQFPEYVKYWKDHPNVQERTPLLAEKVFKVPYRLPSGRVVYLKGKWDSVDLVQGKIWLQENKTKGTINELTLENQLTFDLQTMLYLVALEQYRTHTREPGPIPVVDNEEPIAGIRYNVIRRPLSSGKGCIKQKKGSKNVNPETEDEFYNRLKDDYIAKEPETYFMRWNVKVSEKDIQGFKDQFLNPILEQLCSWYNWIEYSQKKNLSPFDPDQNHGIHWQTPFGIWNALAEGKGTDLDEYLRTGSRVGLKRVKTLFPELEDS